jgi:hypothetical protein
MNRISPFVRNLAILALIAVGIVVLNQQTALATAGFLVSVAVFLALAVVAYMVWRDFVRRDAALWPARAQWVFYGSVGVLVADVVWWIVAGPTGRDALAAFVAGAACIYAGVRTWRDQHRYG